MKASKVSEEWRIRPGVDKEITFENGWKGVFSVAGKETQELSPWDLEVAGRKFTCVPDIKKEFEKFLSEIPDPEVNVMWMYSSECKLPPKKDGRRKKNPEPVKEEKSEITSYNCTIKVPKQYVQPMYDDVLFRAEQFVKLMAEMIMKQAKRDMADKSCEI